MSTPPALECPKCKAVPGEPCRGRRNRKPMQVMPEPHASRTTAAEEAARVAAGRSRYAGIRCKGPRERAPGGASAQSRG